MKYLKKDNEYLVEVKRRRKSWSQTTLGQKRNRKSRQLNLRQKIQLQVKYRAIDKEVQMSARAGRKAYTEKLADEAEQAVAEQKNADPQWNNRSKSR